MECAAHPGTTATATCAVCGKGGCERCLDATVDGAASCSSCAARAEERRETLGSAMLAFVAVGYLTALAVGVVVFRARPFVGGLAAVVAIALGRALQIYVHVPVVVRLPRATARVDGPPQAR